LRAEATRHGGAIRRLNLVTWTAIAAIVVAVFSTWLTDGPVTLNGTQGPNNGWLVVLIALPTIAWARMMGRGSWVGVIGVLGASLVFCWTAIENWREGRDAFGALVSYGLVLVVAAGIVLGATAVMRGVELVRARQP
jgi:hypothetical protein